MNILGIHIPASHNKWAQWSQTLVGRCIAHASSSLNHADGSQALGFAHEKSSLRDPAVYTANCWAFACSRFNETCCQSSGDELPIGVLPTSPMGEG